MREAAYLGQPSNLELAFRLDVRRRLVSDWPDRRTDVMRCLLPVVLGSLLIAGIVGCSKSAAVGGPSAAPPQASVAAASTANPCDGKLVTQADVAAILGVPVTSMKPLDGVPQSCRFETASYSGLSINLGAGRGKMTVAAAENPHMPIPFIAVSGVGDEAAWQASTHALASEKADLLCQVSADGPPGSLGGATEQAMGALCNKVFAAG